MARIASSSCGPGPVPGSILHKRLVAATSTPSFVKGGDLAAQDRLHAILDLAWGTILPASLDRAAATLDRLAAAHPDDPSLLNDYAVAQLAVAERDQELVPLFRALDAIMRARSRDSTAPTILFNEALIEERLFLPDAAVESWERFLAVERTPEWRDEGAHRLRLVRSGIAPVAHPDDSVLVRGGVVAPATLRAAVDAAPQWARDVAWAALATWAAADARGDTSRARGSLAIAAQIGAIQRDLGGDESIVRAAAQLQQLPMGSDSRARLVEAYQLFGASLDGYRRGEYAAVRPRLEQAARGFAGVALPAHAWAQYYIAGCEIGLGDYASAEARLQRLLVERDIRLRSLRGKATMTLGVIHVRRGEIDAANTSYRAASDALEQAHDRETSGFAAFLLSEGAMAAGRRLDSHAASLRAMDLLSPYRASRNLHNQLSLLATQARQDGYGFAALRIMAEAATVARRQGSANTLALTYAERARDQLATGHIADAAVDLDSADAWMQRFPAGRTDERLRAYILLARGEVLHATAPRASLAPLQAATEKLRAFESDLFLPRALSQTAESWRLVGDRRKEGQYLTEAITRLEAQHEGFSSTSGRAAFSETVEGAYDAMITLQLARGQADSAFDYLERGRNAVWDPLRAGGAATRRHSIDEVRARLPERTTLLEFAILQDRVMAWRVTSSGWTSRATPLPRDTLRALVRRLVDEVDADAPPATGSARARLFDAVLRPLLDSLPSGEHIILVPDRELFRVPFAALWDTRQHRYAVEEFEFRSAPSAAFALRSLAHPVRLPRQATLLAVGIDNAPAPPAVHLPALRRAEAEARSIATLSPRSRVLVGAEASHAALMRGLGMADMLHFAGHAVFDEQRPEESFLLLAGDTTLHANQVPAAEIARRRPSRLQLVVLAACSSLNARDGRIGPVSGLASSFLQTGASGIVSSLWPVRDDATEPLLRAFHSRVLAGAPAPEALRQAQLDALHSTDHLQRSPRSWAAFTFSGS